MTPREAFKDHPLSLIASIIIIVGALNWLTIGLAGYNFVDDLFGRNSNIIYIIVGLAGLFAAIHKIMWLLK
jgi:uncharacterized membrane protein YuzA (DUF378 family)